MHILLVEMRLDNIKGICCLKATKNSKRQGIMKLIFRLYTQNRTNDYEITIFCR